MKTNNIGICKSKYKKIGRFLEATLLCILKEESSYVYNIMDKLDQFHFENDTPNSSILYRRLNNMENHDLVVSSWKKSSAGPDKKIYQITEKGIQELHNWMKVLKNRKERIESIIDKYESIK